MHMHVRIHRWVWWWIWVGVVCGAVALANILADNLTHPQEHLVLMIGVLHWVLGGVLCWAFDGVHFQKPLQRQPIHTGHPLNAPEHEWHPASDFLLPGCAKHIVPPGHFSHRR